MNEAEVARIATWFPGCWNRNYVAAKLRTDPLYAALAEILDGSPLPLLDLGCGLGLLAFYLRACGIGFPIHGLDYDARKIEAARRAADQSGESGLSFIQQDTRAGLPDHKGNVSLLDILQYLTPAEQETLLNQAASRVAPGGVLVIRSGLRDSSLRYRITVAGELLAKATFWMKCGRTHFPQAGDFQRILTPYGDVEISPLWGRTPFNNHLIVLRR